MHTFIAIMNYTASFIGGDPYAYLVKFEVVNHKWTLTRKVKADGNVKSCLILNDCVLVAEGSRFSLFTSGLVPI